MCPQWCFPFIAAGRVICPSHSRASDVLLSGSGPRNSRLAWQNSLSFGRWSSSHICYSMCISCFGWRSVVKEKGWQTSVNLGPTIESLQLFPDSCQRRYYNNPQNTSGTFRLPTRTCWLLINVCRETSAAIYGWSVIYFTGHCNIRDIGYLPWFLNEHSRNALTGSKSSTCSNRSLALIPLFSRYHFIILSAQRSF